MANADCTAYGLIYCVENIVSGKRYIGQTTWPLVRRWRQHCCPKSSCKILSDAIQSYGKASFSVKQIDVAYNKQELNEKEEMYIALYYTTNRDHGYNLRNGGNSSKPSEESKRKMSVAKAGRKLTEDHKKHISISGKLRAPGSVESFKKISDSKKGVKFSEEHKRKLSEARMGWVMPDSHKEAVIKASTGRILSAESRKKISDKRKAYWQRVKNAPPIAEQI